MDNSAVITGSSGFVGKALTKRLIEKNFFLTILGNSNYSKISFNWRLGDDLPNAIKGKKYFIHCAYDLNSSNKVTENINIIALRKIIKQIKNLDIIFVFITSQAANKKNSSIYSKVKLECEEIIRSEMKKYIIIRPGMIFDVNEKSNITEMIKKISKFKFFPFFSYEKKIQPIFLDDFVELVIKTLEVEKVNIEYQLCQSTKMNLREFTNYICEISKIPKPIFIFIPFFFLIPLAKFIDLIFLKKLSLADRLQGLETLKIMKPTVSLKNLNYKVKNIEL